MYEVTKEVMFSAAHSIQGAGKCANKHGHNWVATIRVSSDTLDSRGFIVDVRDIKNAAFQYDHDDLDKYFDWPSTENIAQKIAHDVLTICQESNPETAFDVAVHLAETDNNSAVAWAKHELPF